MQTKYALLTKVSDNLWRIDLDPQQLNDALAYSMDRAAVAAQDGPHEIDLGMSLIRPPVDDYDETTKEEDAAVEEDQARRSDLTETCRDILMSGLPDQMRNHP
jgi:hypothetical protein